MTFGVPQTQEMNCFFCSGKSNHKKSSFENNRKRPSSRNSNDSLNYSTTDSSGKMKEDLEKNKKKSYRTRSLSLVDDPFMKEGESENYKRAQSADYNNRTATFTFDELAAATKNFRSDFLLGEGGFGKVYKGQLKRLKKEAAIKQLDRNGTQGMREFVVEVLTLSMADHPNLVKLLGFCAQGSQRLLVYEYMALGSLEDHLYDIGEGRKGLDWSTRMKIAAGAARGLEYLHDKMQPPVIYRDLKCSNILLGEGYHPKLSDFGLAKVGPSGDNTHVSTRVMGTYGYCAPDYAMTGQLTFKSDIYSFGVVLLELITGRKAIDKSRPSKEQNLVCWARPLFKDRKRFVQMVDPLLEGKFPVRGLYQALAIAAMCTQEKPSMRPVIGDVVTALDFLASQKYDPLSKTFYHSRRTTLKDNHHNDPSRVVPNSSSETDSSSGEKSI